MAEANNGLVTGRKTTRRIRSKVGKGSGEAYEADEFNM